MPERTIVKMIYSIWSGAALNILIEEIPESAT